MIKEILKKNYKSILCLDGDLPNYSFFKTLNLPIIAADGVANYLINIDIEPDIIIGDLDGIDRDLLKGRKFIEIKDQNASDFEKSIDYIKDNNLFPSVILGINGGYIDHVLNNINIFSDIDAVFYSDDIIGFVLKGKNKFNLPIGAKISIFGLPNCIISTTGLKWELKNAELTFPGKASCSNRAVAQEVIINIIFGKALIFVYTKIIKDAGIL
ncbi:MAG: thiamine diphosphokinase [Holosporales bacterium]|jgi:thiamine pyrophosphokinase|nr:thiamine diphosphokinase [Holosporales bacterium]